jgi:hypothetical protein
MPDYMLVTLRREKRIALPRILVGLFLLGMVARVYLAATDPPAPPAPFDPYANAPTTSRERLIRDETTCWIAGTWRLDGGIFFLDAKDGHVKTGGSYPGQTQEEQKKDMDMTDGLKECPHRRPWALRR